MRDLIKLSVFLIAGIFSLSVFAEEPAAKLDRQLCSLCHGPGGITTSELFPMLAGQHAEYLEKELKEFREKSRSSLNASRFMWGIASRLSNEEISQLAKFYESQPPAHIGKISNQSKYDEGKNLFNNGNSVKGVPPCLACHGDKAQGNVNIPRLAGQHEQYIKNQLKVFHGDGRPDAEAMHEIVKGLSDDDINSLAHYLQAQ